MRKSETLPVQSLYSSTRVVRRTPSIFVALLGANDHRRERGSCSQVLGSPQLAAAPADAASSGCRPG